MDVGVWLEGLGLGQYAEVFAENDIDAKTLCELTGDDLKELGVASLGHRKKLLGATARLSHADHDSHEVPVAAASLEGERRQVTVLFADLAGYTKLSSELGAEETHALLNHYFEAVDSIVEDYGGTIDKHIGDAVMAVFGAPIAHDNDPLRGVRAAFDIQQSMTALSGKVGHSLRSHIGIASGQVVASGTGSDAHRAYTVTGDSVNLASRLVHLAAAGETVVSDAVWHAVSGHVDGDALGQVAVKGLDQQVHAWRVRTLLGVAAEVVRSAFVGRRSELRQFSGMVETCRETGNGETVVLRGEAGIGKTRLVEELTAIAKEQGFGSHKGLVVDFGAGKDQDAIRSLVRSLLGISLDVEEAQRRAAADQAVAEGALEPNQRVLLNDLLGLPHPVELRAMYDAMDNATRNNGKREVVTRLIRGVSARAPVLLIVEDVHWADPLVLAHLAAMTAAVGDCPAVLVITTRIEGDPLDQAWRATTRGAPLTTIDLGPLREAEVNELAGGFFDATSHYVQNCIERAEGNPLFLEQLLRNAEEAESDDVPASIQSLVLARMDRLDPEEKKALQAASVIGQHFSLDTLQHLLDAPGYTCKSLIEHYLVRPEGGEYIFANALIQEGVYSSLLTPKAQDLHKRLAKWFAERDFNLRAQHLDRASDPAAPQAYLEAARIQASDYHYELALRFVRRGLELARTAADKFALTCWKGELLHDLGSVAASVEAYREALKIADDDIRKCTAWVGLAGGLRVTDDIDGALQALDLAETAAKSHDLPLELSRIHHLRGNLYFPLGKTDSCLQQHEMALERARQAESPESEARALGGLGDAEYARGRMRSAHRYFNECVQLSRKQGFGRIEVANFSMLGDTRLYLLALQGSVDDSLAAIEAAARVSHHRAELIAQLHLYFALFDKFEMDRAKEHIERAQALVQVLGARRFEALNLAFTARILHTKGHQSEAIDVARQAMAISRETAVSYCGPWVLGPIALITNDAHERQEALDEGEQLLHAGSLGHNHFWFYRDAMDAALDDSDWDSVERYAAALETYTSAEPLPWTSLFIAKGRALAKFGRGKSDDATMEELQHLLDEAKRVGLIMALPALEGALGTA